MIYKNKKIEKRIKLVFRAGLRYFIPTSIIGAILGLYVRKDVEQFYVILLFSAAITLAAGITAQMDRILHSFNIRNIPFVHLQIIKVITLALLILLFLGTFFYYTEDNFILANENLALLIRLVIYSWLVSMVVSMVFIINRMIGYNVLGKYFTGNYHTPKEEERIFMFLDLKSSTAIAEQIGHKQFFNFVNDILYDITNLILEFDGEIYKYVGDEIIITWSKKNGVKNNNCINLYFEVENKLIVEKDKYINRYGIVPELKAGVHIGRVIVGILGDIRTEIAYMGDAVNTAARIQSECNNLNEKLLFSGDIKEKLQVSKHLLIKKVSILNLRGKLTSTPLYKASLSTF
nr:adenylate/guanylate cyclase domain-containing protein [uncultured Carboxylicivirga sp.]